MEKVIEFVKKYKWWFTGALIVILIAIMGLLIYQNTREKTEEEILIGYLEDMGKDFYENVYYKKLGGDIETKKGYLEAYSTIGITINLENLGIYDGMKNGEIIEKFVNKAKNTKCDQQKTKVVVYPKSPYGPKNYDLKTTLDCGFDN